MNTYTVKLKFEMNASHQHEADVKVLRLVISGMGNAEFEKPQIFKDLYSWDLDHGDQ